MFDLSTVTFFGLSQAQVGDLAAVSAAIERADSLEPEDLYAVASGFGGETGDLLAKLTDLYFEAGRLGDREGASSAQSDWVSFLRTIGQERWQHRRPEPETKFTLFATANAFRADADRILKVQAARRQLSIEGDQDQKKSRGALQQCALQALEGNELERELLEKIASGQSQLALAAKMILERFDQLKELLQTQTRLELEQKGALIIEEEHQKIFEELRKGLRQIDRELGERMVAFANGPMKLIVAIDTLKQESIASWKEGRESESSILFHRLGNEVADNVFSGATLIDLARAGMAQSSGFILSILSRLGNVQGLSAVVHSAVIKNIMAATAKGIRIEIDAPNDIPIDEAKQAKLEEVLTELICNAVKYADLDKPEKWIRIGWDSERKILTIADDGIGIENTERIWEEGYQVKPNATAERGGLGLAIVKRLLGEIGWAIAVESTVGLGTTFILQKPLTEKEQIYLAKHLFHQMEQITLDFYVALRGLSKNDSDGLKRLVDHLYADMKRLAGLFPSPQERRISLLIADLQSSATQLPSSIASVAGTQRKFFLLKQISWDDMICAILNAQPPSKTEIFVEGRGYRYTKPQSELRFTLVYQYLRSKRPQEGWEGRSWVLTFPKVCAPSYWLPPSAFQNAPWPPRSQRRHRPSNLSRTVGLEDGSPRNRRCGGGAGRFWRECHLINNFI